MEVKDLTKVQRFQHMTKDNNFPSDAVPARIKRSDPAYCYAMLNAMEKEDAGRTTGKFLGRSLGKSFQSYRDYARGRQDIDQYKQTWGGAQKRNKGKKNRTFRNLDYSVLNVATKFVNVLRGKILKRKTFLDIRGIDNLSTGQGRDYEYRLREHLENRQFLQEVSAKTGIQFESPIDPGTPEPEGISEIPLHRELFFKDRMALEMQDLINLSFAVNDWKQIEKDYTDDLIETGYAGVKVYVDVNGFIRLRRVVVESITTNNVAKADFSDMHRCGEFIEITISELKRWAGDQFTEEEYKKIAEISAKRTFDVNTYHREYNSYPYDNEKVTILDGEWLTWDEEIKKVSRNRFGNQEIEAVDDKFLPEGVTDEQYAQQFNGERFLIRKTRQNLYRGCLIVGSQFIFNWGLAKNMPRHISNLKDTKMSYVIQTTDFESTIKQIIPVLNNIQINWLQFQNLIAKSRPQGLDIEISALQQLNIGKGGERMTPKEALQMYFDTGILLWKRKDWAGHNSQWRPIQELNNGISDAAAQHFNHIVAEIDLLRNILGINEVADASAPNPEIGKYVTQTANEATDNALYFLFYAHDKIWERVAKQICLHIPALVDTPALEESLGRSTINFFKSTVDFNFADYSINVEAGPDPEKRNRLLMYVAKAQERDELPAEDAMLIEDEPNPVRGAMMLKYFKQLRLKQRAAMEQQAVQAQTQAELQKNQMSAQASAQAEMMKEEAASRFRQQELAQQHAFTMAEQKDLFAQNMILAKLNGKMDLTDTEKKMAAQILMTRMKVDGQKDVARMRPKPTAA